jgi:hypothetical protein
MNIKSKICSSCGDIIYSRCAEDSQICTCRKTEIKGPLEDPKVLVDGVELLEPSLTDIEVANVDKDILFWDWDLKLDNFGHISEHTHQEIIPQRKYKPNYLIEL